MNEEGINNQKEKKKRQGLRSANEFELEKMKEKTNRSK